jgi:hypothetical protein
MQRLYSMILHSLRAIAVKYQIPILFSARCAQLAFYQLYGTAFAIFIVSAAQSRRTVFTSPEEVSIE